MGSEAAPVFEGPAALIAASLRSSAATRGIVLRYTQTRLLSARRVFVSAGREAVQGLVDLCSGHVHQIQHR